MVLGCAMREKITSFTALCTIVTLQKSHMTRPVRGYYTMDRDTEAAALCLFSVGLIIVEDEPLLAGTQSQLQYNC